LNFLYTLPNNPQISSLKNNGPVGAEQLHASGRTNGRDEANGRFSQFCECT